MMPVRPVQQPVDGALEQLLGGRVQPRGSLVQDDQARILEEDAGQGEQLGLAGGEAATAGSCSVSSPCGRPSNQGHSPSSSQHCQKPLVRDGAVEEGKVVAHAGLEELHVLGHHADAAPQAPLGGTCLMSTPPRRIAPCCGS